MFWHGIAVWRRPVNIFTIGGITSLRFAFNPKIKQNFSLLHQWVPKILPPRVTLHVHSRSPEPRIRIRLSVPPAKSRMGHTFESRPNLDTGDQWLSGSTWGSWRTWYGWGRWPIGRFRMEDHKEFLPWTHTTPCRRVGKAQTHGLQYNSPELSTY